MKNEKYEFKGDTPPWRIASSNKKEQFYVIHGQDMTATKLRELQVLCINYGSHPIKEQLDKTQANAHLIAAAPDLLQALINIEKWNVQQAIDQYGDASKADGWACVVEARNAIHKALNIKQEER